MDHRVHSLHLRQRLRAGARPSPRWPIAARSAGRHRPFDFAQLPVATEEKVAPDRRWRGPRAETIRYLGQGPRHRPAAENDGYAVPSGGATGWPPPTVGHRRNIAVLRRSHEICKAPVSLSAVIHQFTSCGSSSSRHAVDHCAHDLMLPWTSPRWHAAGVRR